MVFFRNEDDANAPAPATGRVLPLLPLRDIVVYPHAVVPLFDWHRRVRGAAVGVADTGAPAWRDLLRYRPAGWAGRIELVDESGVAPCCCNLGGRGFRWGLGGHATNLASNV